jgi:predicted ABC-type ATPase
MINSADFDRRPIIIAVAGPNGAGKSTFYQTYLAPSKLQFVNADVLAIELNADAYDAARVADDTRRSLVASGESFIFETVLSDPVGDKVAFLEDAVRRGYTVFLCYIGLSAPEQSVERVAMRVSKSGHDVPTEKLKSRFSRTLDNLRLAIQRLPHVLVYDNSDLAMPFRQVAVFEHGRLRALQEPIPDWLRSSLP